MTPVDLSDSCLALIIAWIFTVCMAAVLELQTADDILTCVSHFTAADERAGSDGSFRGIDHRSATTKTTQFNDAVHLMAHQVQDERKEKKADKKSKKAGRSS